MDSLRRPTRQLLEVAFHEALAVARELMNDPNPRTALRAAQMVMQAERALRDRRAAETVVYVHVAPAEPDPAPARPPALPGGTP